MKEVRIVSPGLNGNITNEFGIAEKPPIGWVFLPAGDAALTRKVTAQGLYWRVQVKKGRRVHSKGVWAPEKNIQSAKNQVEKMRLAPDYEKKRATALKLREKKQRTYTISFKEAIKTHLNFHGKYKDFENKMANLVTEHAIPIGSGTVARTTLLPIEERAAKAVNAWMRHQTTDYDQMKIARVKGERRAVRKKLASQSKRLLETYRNGSSIDSNCLLKKALCSQENEVLPNLL